MKTTTPFVCLAALPALTICFAPTFTSTAQADPFGSGTNAFDIDFVTIGNPGNVADTTGAPNPAAGSVSYSYRIGKFEISEDMVDKANAMSAAAGNPLNIAKNSRGPNKPATDISWFEAAKFVNWLNMSAGSMPAYKFNGNGNFQLWEPGDVGYNSDNLYRNSLARYFLPSANEWHKAAYYNPLSETYSTFPLGSNTPPVPTASGTTSGTAVYSFSRNIGPADIGLAGGPGPYGTVGQGGNAAEWDESQYDLANDEAGALRGVRGGSWTDSDFFLMNTYRIIITPGGSNSVFGLRVASVIPEPTSLLLAVMANAGLLMRRRWLS